MPQVKFVKLHPDAKMPTKATDGSACWDLYSNEEVKLTTSNPYKVQKIHTGISIEIPDGYFLDIRPRSGLSGEGVIITNSPGTIDSDYIGEVIILLASLAYTHIIDKGDRICQCRLVPIIPIEWVEVDKLSETERGEGGFGSTGR
jgi:dUTP pyrophosphatase